MSSPSRPRHGAGRLLGAMAGAIHWCLSPGKRAFRKARPLIQAVEGLLPPAHQHWLFMAARRLPNDATIVEVGSYKGRSTLCLALACKGTRKHVYSIDTFNGNESDFTGPGRRSFFSDWKANIARNQLDACVTPIVSDSREAAKGWDRPINLLFIDGSHVYEDAPGDFDGFFPKVKKGGVVAMHDVGSHEGATRAWRERMHLLTGTGSCSTLAYGTKP